MTGDTARKVWRTFKGIIPAGNRNGFLIQKK